MGKKKFLNGLELKRLNDIICDFFTERIWYQFIDLSGEETRPYNEVLKEWMVDTIFYTVSKEDLISKGYATIDDFN